MHLWQRLASYTEAMTRSLQGKVVSTLNSWKQKLILICLKLLLHLLHQNWILTTDSSPQSQNTIFTGEKKKCADPKYPFLPWPPYSLHLFKCFSNWVHRGGCNIIWFCQKHFFFQDRISPCIPKWTRTHHVDQAGLKLVVILLPWPPRCWHYRLAPPCLCL